MYDPLTAAHEIKIPNPFIRDKSISLKKKSFFRKPYWHLATIWHKDPCKDGTDDSCGWFLRLRHCDKKMYEQICSRFRTDWKDWYNAVGYPRFSIPGMVINMYRTAAWIIFKQNRKKMDKYLVNHLPEILYFAENYIDSIRNQLMNGKEENINSLVSVIYTYILRDIRPWYKHPRWHVHHWRIQFIPFSRIKWWWRYRKDKGHHPEAKNYIDSNLRDTV